MMPENEWQALAGTDGLDSDTGHWHSIWIDLGSSRVFGLYPCSVTSTRKEAGLGCLSRDRGCQG